jgi:hypothetical protein
MTINAGDWKGLIAPAVGGILAVVPIYLLFVRQMMSNKDAVIETLREQNKSLERERLPTVIQEKQTLTEDIAARAKEKAETDKAMEQMTETIRRVTGNLQTHAENTHQAIAGITGKANQLTELSGRLQRSKRDDQSLGLILGAKMLQESYVEWRLLFTELQSSPGTSEFDAYLRARWESIVGVLNRVRDSGDLIKIEELTLDPEVQKKMAEINKAKYPAGLKTA